MNLGQILSERLQLEGWPQITNRPSDQGGLTKGGITFISYQAWLKQKGRKPLVPAEFSNLTEDQAREFMLDSIAGPLMDVAMIDVSLFTVMFDWAMTSGPDDPVRAVQEELRERHIILRADGVYGIQTAASLNAYWTGSPKEDQLNFTQAIRDRRIQHYLNLTFKDKYVRELLENCPESQLHNLQGWINRAQMV